VSPNFSLNPSCRGVEEPLIFASTAIASDLDDVKIAFDTFKKYQKTDDVRSLDLFTKDCKFIFTLTDGVKNEVVQLPTSVFLKDLKKIIARKEGFKKSYEDVKYAKERFGIRVTAMTVDSDGRREPFSALYLRSEKSDLLIKELKSTVVMAGNSQPEK